VFEIDQIPLWIANNFVSIDAPFRVPMSLRILVAEDSALVRYSVRSLLQRCPDFHVVGEACDGFQAIDQSTTLQPDVVLLDVSMPNLSGLGAAPRIHEVSPESKILMFSQYGSANVVTAAMNAGALGYVMKSDVGRDLVNGLRATSLGRRFFSSGVMTPIFV